MELNYFLFIYSESADTDSGVPLGIIAHDGQNALVKAIGLSDNWDIDLAPFKAISKIASASAWVYEAWLITLKEFEADTRDNLALFEELINDLGDDPVGFSVIKDGYVEIPEDGTTNGAVDYLYQELVLPAFQATV